MNSKRGGHWHIVMCGKVMKMCKGAKADGPPLAITRSYDWILGCLAHKQVASVPGIPAQFRLKLARPDVPLSLVAMQHVEVRPQHPKLRALVHLAVSSQAWAHA